MFTRAIVRPPAANFAEGLTTAALGAPDYDCALGQHEAYCQALQKCGLSLVRLAADQNYPDSCFVEDVAVVVETPEDTTASTNACAVITRPGAPSRVGEIETMKEVFADLFSSLHTINAPGTLDGGDICQAADHFFIGISARTNEAGAAQLAGILARSGYTASFVNIRNHSSALHLKSELAYIGDRRLVITDELADRPEFGGYDLIRVAADESYAGNCVRVND